jgi:hypothetical protein
VRATQVEHEATILAGADGRTDLGAVRRSDSTFELGFGVLKPVRLCGRAFGTYSIVSGEEIGW